MTAYNYLYSVPYIIFFLCLYINCIPIIPKKVSLYQYNYNLSIQVLISAMMMIVFIGFRGYVFTDWMYYSEAYSISPSLIDGKSAIHDFITTSPYATWENGFLFYILFCKTISANYFFLQITSFIIDFFIVFLFFKKYIPQYIIFGFLFFILFSGLMIEFNLLRNSKSLMLFLISIKYIDGKNPIKYLLLNGFGCLFHTSSLLYIPLYFILKKDWSRKVILALFVIGNLIFLLQIQWIKAFLISVSSMIPFRLGDLIRRYIASEYYSSPYGITIGYLERLFSFILIYSYSNVLCKAKNNILFINTFFLYSFIYLYCSEMFIILQRIPLMFVFSYWVLYPQIYSFLSKQYKQIFLIILLFYGILKMFSGYDDFYAFYDNVLFIHKSRSERVDLHTKLFSFLQY